MFHLKSLELVHWDYCQRVSLPLDATIVTIAGPNGSGKTTLLDAMRTLLGLNCSHPRDFKTYARHAGASTAWLRAVVDNRSHGKQTSKRPFGRRLLYADQVTLACRIEKNGGDWQRRYMMCDGDVSVEQLTERTDKELQVMGVESWRKALADAGLSAAIAKVLSLEQGQTDRLCELSPKELLRLIFDVFGDQEVLNQYEQAREHQRQLTREMQAAEQELNHSKMQLAELQHRSNNYKLWKNKLAERERLATEVVPVLAWFEERSQLASNSQALRKQRQQLSRVRAQRSQHEVRLLELLSAREQADATEQRLLDERRHASDQLELARKVESPLEELSKRQAELQSLAQQEGDSTAIQARLEQLQSQLRTLNARYDKLHIEKTQSEQALEALADQKIAPPPDDARQLRQQLKKAGVEHLFLAEVVQIKSPLWRDAIEGSLRGFRWMVLLQKPDDVARADQLASDLRYRHYIVCAAAKTQSSRAPISANGTLLQHISFEANVPDWLIVHMQQLRCVQSPAEGRRSAGSWITPQAYSFDGRGARSVWIAPREHQFGTAAIAARREALEQDLQRIDQALLQLSQQRLPLKRQIADCQQSLAGHSAAQELDRRSDEFAQAQSDLPAAKQSRIVAASRWQNLDSAYGQARLSHQEAASTYQAAQKQLAEQLRSAQESEDDLRSKRKQLDTSITRSQALKQRLPVHWRSAQAMAQLQLTYRNSTQAQLRLASVDTELTQSTWEQDETLEERHHRMGVTVREQDANLADHRAKNAGAEIAVNNARDSYIEVLRSTVRRYRNNIQELGALAGVQVQADLPALENDDTVLHQAGLKVNFDFDGKGSIGLNDGEASGGQQVIKSLILLVGLLKDEDSATGGFVFIDEPFAHLDVRNIQLVGHFLRSTQAQYVLTTPITHNLEVFEPAEITLVTSKKAPGSKWAPPIAVAKRRGLPQLAALN
jgi:chromosome segregation ATPase